MRPVIFASVLSMLLVSGQQASACCTLATAPQTRVLVLEFSPNSHPTAGYRKKVFKAFYEELQVCHQAVAPVPVPEGSNLDYLVPALATCVNTRFEMRGITDARVALH